MLVGLRWASVITWMNSFQRGKSAAIDRLQQVPTVALGHWRPARPPLWYRRG